MSHTELMVGLRALTMRIAQARYYVQLETADSSSGFHPVSMKRSGAITEAREHLSRYPVWQVARVYNRDTSALVKTIRQSEVNR